MKKMITISLVLTAVVLGLQATAQKRITEGTISYDIVVHTGDNKPTIATMFDGATSIVYLKGYLSRSEMISSLGTQATIVDAKSGNATVLKEYGAQKYMINMTPVDWKDANRKNEGVTYTFSEEYKEIAGYKCQKAAGRFSDGTTFTVYFTKDLVADNRDFEYAYKTLPGLAMQYETTVGNLKVTYTVAKISFNVVPASKFELPKTGYRVMTYQESKNARGGIN
jgi:GLPGLI family protein